jgi:hypothetical protein
MGLAAIACAWEADSKLRAEIRFLDQVGGGIPDAKEVELGLDRRVRRLVPPKTRQPSKHAVPVWTVVRKGTRDTRLQRGFRLKTTLKIEEFILEPTRRARAHEMPYR